MTLDARPTLANLLAENERTIGIFYRLATILLVGSLIAHLAFASYYVLSATAVENGNVLIFAIFNVAALVVEVYLGRIAFMLGSRAGQLRDMQYALLIAEQDIDTMRFELAAKAIMSLRRDVGGLKVLDVESIVNRLSSGKPSGKDAS
ncbi:hypothetical protein [Thauera sp.]|jgi:hypothetical protein|uniref:hypothetical protein n=1 Tax=Thauera sp. TaxID=1905334 RepID=UPI002A35CEA6|nr:hypothetical protein [Thauera sp.]MDX9886678.1 hypothetical protein [Thauera sp.]